MILEIEPSKKRWYPKYSHIIMFLFPFCHAIISFCTYDCGIWEHMLVNIVNIGVVIASVAGIVLSCMKKRGYNLLLALNLICIAKFLLCVIIRGDILRLSSEVINLVNADIVYLYFPLVFSMAVDIVLVMFASKQVAIMMKLLFSLLLIVTLIFTRCGVCFNPVVIALITLPSFFLMFLMGESVKNRFIIGLTLLTIGCTVLLIFLTHLREDKKLNFFIKVLNFLKYYVNVGYTRYESMVNFVEMIKGKILYICTGGWWS